MKGTSRREWMAGSLGVLAGSLPKPGCQTNAWTIDSPQSFLHTLERIRNFGYRGFETSFRNLEGKAALLQKPVAESGLRLIGVHIWLPEYGPPGIATTDLIERVIAICAEFSAERLILSGGPPAAGLNAKVEALARAQETARAARLGFAYHNHGAEFANRGAEMEVILGRTTVPLILDAGHAWLAGTAITDFFTRNHGRIAGVHLRDFREREQVPLGKGEVDYASFAAAAKKSGWSGWVINEEERLNNVKPGDEAVAPARAFLKTLFGV